MKRKSASQAAFWNLRASFTLLAFVKGALLVVLAAGASSEAFAQAKLMKPIPNAAQTNAAKAGFHITDDNFWASTGGPQGGDVATLVTNANGFVFAGTQGGGVFRSSDNGATWTPVNTGLTSTDIHALATNSAGDLFAGTFGGAFRSTDNGDTWTS